jgi:hypothetical protein
MILVAIRLKFGEFVGILRKIKCSEMAKLVEHRLPAAGSNLATLRGNPTLEWSQQKRGQLRDSIHAHGSTCA